MKEENMGKEDVSKDWTLEQYTDWHNKYASDYPFLDNWYDSGPHWHRTSWIMESLEKHPVKSISLLDCGCSNGGLLKFLTDSTVNRYADTSKIVGFDIADFFVSNAQKNAPGAICLAAPIERLPFASDSFDVVIAGEILEHVLDISTAIAQAKRVLKPGGMMITTTPSDPNSVGGTHLRYCSEDMLRELLPGAELKYHPDSWMTRWVK